METTVFTGYISTPCGKDIHSKREADVESGKSDLPEKEERSAKPMSEYYSDARDKEKSGMASRTMDIEKARLNAGGRGTEKLRADAQSSWGFNIYRITFSLYCEL